MAPKKKAAPTSAWGNALATKLTEDARTAPRMSLAANADLVTRQILVDRIQPRFGGNVRKYKPENVVELAGTIAAIGLLQGPVIDAKNRVLAGNTRRCACLLLRTMLEAAELPEEARRKRIAERLVELSESHEAMVIHSNTLDEALTIDASGFEKAHPGGVIPVRIMDFDAEKDPARALEVEVAENEKRRDFTRQDVFHLVEQLEEKGFTRQVGAQPGGAKAKPLIPALALIIGKSRSQVYRILNPNKTDTSSAQPSDNLRAISLRFLKDLPILEAGYSRDHSAQAKALLQATRALNEALTAILQTSHSKKTT